MKLWIRLLLTMLAVAVLPLLFLSRYAASYFHHFSKERQEQQMEQAAHLMGEMFRWVEDDSARRQVLESYAERSGRRLRFFDGEGRLRLDTGDVGEVEFGENADVARALSEGEYVARWWLNDDRSRLYYFSSLPVMDEEGLS